MKKLFIVANWKSFKTQAETIEWIKKIKETSFTDEEIRNKEVIVCPQFPLLSLLYDFVADAAANEKMLIRIGSQDISPFEEGAHTGAVSARLLQEFCAYSIIGHSERRQQFAESDAMIADKVSMAVKNTITPILCVQSKDTAVPEGTTIVAYEPVSAIGTGNPDTPENAEAEAKAIKEKTKVPYVLYGGSVKGENVHTFTSMEHIDGVLVGGASLDPDKFVQIIKNA